MRDNTNGIDYKEIDIFKYNKQQYNIEIWSIQEININIDLNDIVIVFESYLENVVKNITRRKIIENRYVNLFNEEVRRLKSEKKR